MKQLLSNEYVRYTLILLVGVGIGAIFYPTKSIEREIESKYQSKIERVQQERRYIEEKYSQELNREIKSNIEYRKEIEKKMSSLKTENTELKQKVKERKLKIVKPDGTIVEETFKETDTEMVSRVVTEIRSEFNEKVSSIEKKYEKVHEKRVREIKDKYLKKIKEQEQVISEYKKKESIKINERNFGISLGMLDNDDFFSNVSYDIYGPFFLDVHLQSDRELEDKRFGLGLGLRF